MLSAINSGGELCVNGGVTVFVSVECVWRTGFEKLYVKVLLIDVPGARIDVSILANKA
jgi:hypothetical protein